MTFTEFNAVIVRFGGEIGIKGKWTKHTYEKLLLKNLKRVLKHYNSPFNQVYHTNGRIYVLTETPIKTATYLTKLFGVSSVSPAVQISSEMDVIVHQAINLAAATFKRETTFAIRCRRVGDHPYSSMDVCKRVGEQVLTRLAKRDLRVDLKNPQVTLNVEVRQEYAYLFTKTLRGAGGFPVGAQSKVVCLLSGGIDSPVACWLVMKRGCTIVPIHFNNFPLIDEKVKKKALEIAEKLFEWAIGFPRRMYIVENGENLAEFIRKAPRKLTCILCKRLMYRIAERLAAIEGAEGIVTGEAIGEQASQTISNLKVLNEAAVHYPVHRPLLGFDKWETEKLARKIGTFNLSIQPTGGCRAVPHKPSTQAKLELVKKAEDLFDLPVMVERSVKSAVRISL